MSKIHSMQAALLLVAWNFYLLRHVQGFLVLPTTSSQMSPRSIQSSVWSPTCLHALFQNDDSKEPTETTPNDKDDDGWGDDDSSSTITTDSSKLKQLRALQQKTTSTSPPSRTSTSTTTTPSSQEQERDLFIPIFALVSLAGLFGAYGYEMLRLYSRGELYLPWNIN